MRRSSLIRNTAYANVSAIAAFGHDFDMDSVMGSEFSETDLITPTVGNPSPGRSFNLPLTPIPSGLLSPPLELPEPETPSSVVVEFGDRANGTGAKEGQAAPQARSAAELVERVHRSYSQTRSNRADSRSRHSEDREGRRGSSRSRSRTINVVGVGNTSRSHSTHSTHSSPRGLTDSREGRSLTHERSSSLAQDRELSRSRVSRFLREISTQVGSPVDKDVQIENRKLQREVDALKRREKELANENKDLKRQLQLVREHNDIRRRQWKDDLHAREESFASELMRTKEQVAYKDNLLRQMANSLPKKIPSLLSDKQVFSWFSSNESHWHHWSQDFASQDPNQLTRKLHPSQLDELCSGVHGFVRITENGKLPDQIINGGSSMVQVLLHGMLANFICNETLGSPFWVFGAISTGAAPESPTTPGPQFGPSACRTETMPVFNDIASLRSAHPTGAGLFSPMPPTPRVPQIDVGPSTLGFPTRFETENLYHMLFEAQNHLAIPDVTVHHWRANMIRLFAESGMGIKNPEDAGQNEVRRLLVEARQNYAKRLRDRFLGGPCRFLLKDQDPAGIEKLEQRLTKILDDALLFSCQLWSRITPIRIHGWRELGEREFKSTSQIMSLCHDQDEQQQTYNKAKGKSLHGLELLEVNHEGSTVIMIVQPAIEAVGMANPDTANANGEEDDVSRLWLRSRVMVTAPSPSSPPTRDIVTAKAVTTQKSVSAPPPLVCPSAGATPTTPTAWTTESWTSESEPGSAVSTQYHPSLFELSPSLPSPNSSMAATEDDRESLFEVLPPKSFDGDGAGITPTEKSMPPIVFSAPPKAVAEVGQAQA